MQIPIDIQIDFLWGEQHFKKDNWGPITYIVGANGTGKSVFAEKLKIQLKQKKLKVRYFGADRIANLASKWDNTGHLASDRNQKGLDIGNFPSYRSQSDELGQSIDALIELQSKLDLQIKIESILAGTRSLGFNPMRYKMNRSYKATVICRDGDEYSEKRGREEAKKKVLANFHRALDKKLNLFEQDLNDAMFRLVAKCSKPLEKED